MAQFVNDNQHDVLLNRIKANAAKLVVCAGQPTTFLQAQTASGTTIPAAGGTGKRLGETTISSADFTGPANSTLAAGGRKYTKAQETGIAITVTGTADHIAIVTTTVASELMLVNTISNSQTVTTGNTATINSWLHHVTDPTV